MFKIANGNDFDFETRFNGKDFMFPAGKAVFCEDDAAAHIFAVGQADKTAVLARHGWVKPGELVTKGLDILGKFSFDHVTPAYDAPLADVAANAQYDHGKAPVVQNAPATKGAADDALAAAGAVEAAARKRAQPVPA